MSLLTGCSIGHGSSATPDPDAAVVRTAADRTVCQHVQRVFLALAEVSGHWDAVRKPFDPVIAREFNPYNHELRLEARAADTVQLRVVIERNADALGNLTQAMLSRRQVRVDSAVAESRRAYAALPACAHRDGKPSRVLKTPATRPSSRKRATAAPTAVDPVCAGVKKTYDGLSPVTARWNLDKNPYDARTAAAFRSAADALRTAANSAGQDAVRRTLQANARDFDRLAAAMRSHRKAAVRQGVINMQQTAVDLAGLCPL